MTDEPELAANGGGRQQVPAEDAPAYEIQLAGVRVWEVSGTRPVENDPELRDSSVDAARTSDWISDDRTSLRVRWRATVRYPYALTRVIIISCTVEGRFTATAPVPQRAFERFKDREAFVLLWPYLRASVAQVAAMMDAKVPPLPTVDVRKVVGPRRRSAGSTRSALSRPAPKDTSP